MMRVNAILKRSSNEGIQKEKDEKINENKILLKYKFKNHENRYL